MHDNPELPAFSAAALRVLREDEASRRELDAAYERFARAPRRHSRGLLVSRWALAGLAMGLSVAFAAETVVQQFQNGARMTSPSATSAHAASRKAAPISASAPPAAESPEPVAEPEPVVAEAKNPRGASWAAPKASASDSLLDRAPADGAVWARAAQGLRNNDLGETESALSVLERAASASDREAARLIRAQLMIHQGNSDGARALLEDLAAHAQSSLVRSKARALFDQAYAKSNSPLSTAPSGT